MSGVSAFLLLHLICYLTMKMKHSNNGRVTFNSFVVFNRVSAQHTATHSIFYASRSSGDFRNRKCYLLCRYKTINELNSALEVQLLNEVTGISKEEWKCTFVSLLFSVSFFLLFPISDWINSDFIVTLQSFH